MYDEQSGQVLYSQVQRGRGAVGDKYGESKRLFLPRKKKSLKAHKTVCSGTERVAPTAMGSILSQRGSTMSSEVPSRSQTRQEL